MTTRALKKIVNENVEEIVPEIIEKPVLYNAEETVSENKETVFIYVGPTNNFTPRFAIYKNGYPPHLKAQMEEFPLLKSLFIHPEKLSEFEKNVRETGTVENIWFHEAKKYFSKAVSR